MHETQIIMLITYNKRFVRERVETHRTRDGSLCNIGLTCDETQAYFAYYNIMSASSPEVVIPVDSLTMCFTYNELPFSL